MQLTADTCRKQGLFKGLFLALSKRLFRPETDTTWTFLLRPQGAEAAKLPGKFAAVVTCMSVEIFLQAVETLAVVVGVGFAIVQVRQYRTDKHREAAIELLHSFQTPTFARALNIVYYMPDGLSLEEAKAFAGDEFHLVYAMMTTWESLGILVYRGEVDLKMVDDFFSGAIVVSWRKLEKFVVGERRIVGRETFFEWFQWLYERLEEAETQTPPTPAHIEHKNWRPL